MLCRKVNVSPLISALKQVPEAFNRVGVNVSAHLLASFLSDRAEDNGFIFLASFVLFRLLVSRRYPQA